MLIFVDGCSHYATDDILRKWSLATSATITAANPRRAGAKSIAPYSVFPLQTPIFASTDFLACGFAVRPATRDLTVDFYKGSTTQVRLRLLGDNLSVYRGPGTTLLATLDTTTLILAGSWYYLEFGATIDDSAGTVEVRLNGIPLPALTLTGQDTKPSTETGVDRVQFVGGNNQLTDIYLDTESFHGDCIVETLYPTGAGNHADWTPSAGDNYQNVDDPGDIDDDATYNATLSQGAKDSFVAGNVAPRPTSTIRGVAVHLTARKDNAAGRVIKPMLRVDGTDHLHADDGQILIDTYAGMQRIWETNPETGLAWLESGINGAEIGYDLVTAL